MPDLVTPEMLVSFGLAAAFTLPALERVIPILPSYVLFVLMGSLLVDGWQDFVAVLLVSATGSTAGAALVFVLGAWLGAARCRAFVDRYQRWLFVSIETYDRLVALFGQNAGKIVFLCQTVPGVRILIAAPAGVMGMGMRSFLAANFAGSLVWNGLLLAGGVVANQVDVSLPVMIAVIVGGLMAIEAVLLMCFAGKAFKRAAS